MQLLLEKPVSFYFMSSDPMPTPPSLLLKEIRLIYILLPHASARKKNAHR